MVRILLFLLLLFLLACNKSNPPTNYQKINTDTEDILYKIIKNSQKISVIGGYVWLYGYEKTFDLSLNLIHTDTFSNKGLFDVCINHDGNQITVGTDGYLFEKKKGNADWQFHRLSHWDILEHIIETPNGYIAYGGKAYETGYIYQLNKDFTTDTVLYFGHEISKIFTNDSGRLISVGWGQVDVSEDGGYTWQTLDIKGDFFVSGLFTDAKNGIIIGANGSMLKTKDGGLFWHKSTTKIARAGFNSFRSIVKIDNIIFILGNGGLLWKSEDDGESWKLTELPESVDIYDILKLDDQSYIICGSNGTLAKVIF